MSLRDRCLAIAGDWPGVVHATADSELPSLKVGGKMFATFGHVEPGVSVKTDSIDTATMLIDAGVAGRAPYFHRSWVRLPEAVAEDELRHRLGLSYDLVRASLKKAEREALPPRETA
ncbi:MmcQ/YjbR family DNA-binding protein [Histidinibacterium lentulum]|uniref:MmcQ/YjbR family DNA-binding protein n=1 Tax=Histidinibacterium lentulum TaxID=2480588 RepID=A0A3N2R8H4_9RHOB|nr:MmcQ/YjbR family DNA-binding protein [Histidinibacterium lentulum]ROU03718.1 MmcQ/YjbR family DNA-binding protein [Histidinibacterium lentulum]